jgi:hypothetical protein
MSNRSIASKNIAISIHIIKHKDIVGILDEIKFRNIKLSVVMRQLLREYRDRGYRTGAEYKEAVENGEVELEPHMV